MAGLGKHTRGGGKAKIFKPSDPIVKRRDRSEGILQSPLTGSDSMAPALNTEVNQFKKGGRVGLYANINRRKKLGISRPKSKSTISKKAYANMKKGFPK